MKGANKTPAYRGLAYVVLEDFYLTPHGNRIPNFEVEIFRGSPDGTVDAVARFELANPVGWRQSQLNKPVQRSA